MNLTVLHEASWILGDTTNKIVVKRKGFWSKNAPVKYRNKNFTDPQIPKSVILSVAKKHPKGLHGARSAIQSFINLGMASGKAMDRIVQIGGWLSDEIKKSK
jgi:hypothetical protein